MKLGLGLGLTGRFGAGSGARIATSGGSAGLRLDASAVYQATLMEADPKQNLFLAWVNDPPSADRVGRYRVWGA